MRKLNLLFCFLCAALCFFTTFERFDTGYTTTINYPFYNKEKSGDFVRFQVRLNTDTIHHDNTRLNRALIAFYESLPYSGAIHDLNGASFDTSFEASYHNYYISNKDDDAFNHLSFDRPLSDKPFSYSRLNEHFTNDPNDAKATALFRPFNQFSDTYNTFVLKPRIIYNTLRAFTLPQARSHKLYNLMFMIPHAEVAAFETLFYTSFLMPNYQCDTQKTVADKLCGMDYSKHSGGIPYIETRMRSNLFSNPFQFSNALVHLTFLSHLLTLLYMYFKAIKHVAIRRVIGNRDLTIFKRIFLRPFLESIILFSATFVILSVIFVNFSMSQAAHFLTILVTNFCIICFILAMVICLFYIFLNVLWRTQSLKNTPTTRHHFHFCFMTKTLIQTLLIVTLVPLLKGQHLTLSYIKHIDANPFLKKGVIIAHVQMARELNVHELSKNYQLLFDYVEKYEHEFISNNALDSYDEETLPYRYLIMNRNALKNYDILNRNGQKVAIQKLTKNTLLVPLDSVDTFHKLKLDTPTDILIVAKTPAFIAPTPHQLPIENAIILVLVNPESHHLDGITFSSIRLLNDADHHIAFRDHVLQDIGVLESIKSIDLYQTTKDSYHKFRFEVFTVSFISLIMVSINAMMIGISYIESRRTRLAIQTMMGTTKKKRFARLASVFIISPFVVSGAILFYNQTLNPLIDSPITLPCSLTLNLVIFILDWFSFGITLKHFEQSDTPSILKGHSRIA